MSPEAVVREFWRLMGTNDFPAVQAVARRFSQWNFW